MGRSSVEATKVLRMCAVRAIRSARLARLPLLEGLRFNLLLVVVLADVFEACDFPVDAPLELDFAFELAAVFELVDALTSPVDVFFLLDDWCAAAVLG